LLHNTRYIEVDGANLSKNVTSVDPPGTLRSIVVDNLAAFAKRLGARRRSRLSCRFGCCGWCMARRRYPWSPMPMQSAVVAALCRRTPKAVTTN